MQVRAEAHHPGLSGAGEERAARHHGGHAGPRGQVEAAAVKAKEWKVICALVRLAPWILG